MKLKDKVAIITGAAQGIGEAYATRFAAEGALVVVADLNEEKGKQVAASIGGSAIFERLDVSSEADTRRVAKAVVDRFGRIDILLNNAAIFYGIDNQNSSYEYLRKIFDVNYFGAWLMCRAVFPFMKEQQSGVVINQSSTAAHMHPPMPIEYQTSIRRQRFNAHTIAQRFFRKQLVLHYLQLHQSRDNGSEQQYPNHR